LPYPENCVDRYYHLDPHPQFCANDSYIVCESTAIGANAAVCVTPVEEVIRLCREKGEKVIPRFDVADGESGWRKEISGFSF
jgi:hypothetical protein